MLKIMKPLSLIISLQLLVSCNEHGANTLTKNVTAPTTEVQPAELEISGVVAKVFHTFSTSLFPEAMAEDGILYLYDYTDPESAKELYSIQLKNTKNFKFNVLRSDVADRLIKLKYVSFDDADNVKEILVDSKVLEAKTKLKLDNESSIASILKERELVEIKKSATNITEVKKEFNNLTILKYSVALGLLDEAVMTKLLKNPDVGKKAAQVVIAYTKSSNAGEHKKYEATLHELASSIGILEESLNIECGDPVTITGNPGKHSYFMRFKPLNDETIKYFSDDTDLSVDASVEEMNKTLSSISSKMETIAKIQNVAIVGEVTLYTDKIDSGACKVGKEKTVVVVPKEEVKLYCLDNGSAKVTGDKESVVTVYYRPVNEAKGNEERNFKSSIKTVNAELSNLYQDIRILSKSNNAYYYGNMTVVYEDVEVGVCAYGKPPKETRKLLCANGKITVQNTKGVKGLSINFKTIDEKTLKYVGSLNLGSTETDKQGNAILKELKQNLNDYSLKYNIELKGNIQLLQDDTIINTCQIVSAAPEDTKKVAVTKEATKQASKATVISAAKVEESFAVR